ncbi:hypothetical protein ACCH09_001001 [Edwardsiella ictaluri]|uniref:Uncharacterized protein n=1 Tax=Edwardsiella ictaluri TaxID=67780 RepID=A0ABY8GDV6_EDWIC|nr:hypothetical protein [Edwardsiella ictaluri]EKS7762564.1 hypothetical protein [Edwardsiella ictaluri]EKS7769266.1 hypothetical protein [Edwardsiella ictaluri]EKS7772415.1 hypothetical protein [Edwardsiella ictaluri]EKS7775939.1 hypothetical protein [Edwardsiella ictaluri]EKS7786202.1 hypothetical protein [Edwardsiella ictaluri]
MPIQKASNGSRAKHGVVSYSRQHSVAEATAPKQCNAPTVVHFSAPEQGQISPTWVSLSEEYLQEMGGRSPG